MPEITLYFLQASRSIRTAWLLEELDLPYNVKFSDRKNNKAPQAFKDESDNPLGKFPTLKDGKLTICESGAITEYLCDTYDTEGRIIPQQQPARTRVQQWVHAAEGTFLLHALPITYARWFSPQRAQDNGDVKELEKNLSVNVQKDLDWLDEELENSKSGFLVGKTLTAADIMVHFSVQFIFARGLGVKGVDTKRWNNVAEWVDRCEKSDGYQRAFKKTGYTLFPKNM
ncbi:putative glutathione S-transferase 3-like [Venturia nashicola]|uniref:Putative glutathione S-transferase 3-like n=1 Tax=Venturia nashicola TaxID=86259 RepID=A0A4Z1P4N7_9PEZI|nr:putative glutathione S-transferase 3-like [Venturia nashicola]TLD36444.1 putative glutathione S-transferase 3-like [Venturia nashicola]